MKSGNSNLLQLSNIVEQEELVALQELTMWVFPQEQRDAELKTSLSAAKVKSTFVTCWGTLQVLRNKVQWVVGGAVAEVVTDVGRGSLEEEVVDGVDGLKLVGSWYSQGWKSWKERGEKALETFAPTR